jgi:UDP-N-acetylmuramoyl-tripeptide--D-alanyl-D-alanine ligase
MIFEDIYACFRQCGAVTTDSRNCPPGAMFFALRGDNFDGNRFAAGALRNGCSCAVVDDPACVADERYLLVDDVLTALQQLASYHRLQFDIPVIGITGTNGKTTTKELIAAVLGRKFVTHFTQGNFNNHIGVPLTLLRLNASHQMAVIEMGANHPGEIKDLTAIARPGFGIITNVGKAHLEGFGSFEGVIRTKSELYDFERANGGAVFVNLDNEILSERSAGITRYGYGLQSDDGLVRGEISGCSPFLQLKWWPAGSDEWFDTTTNLIGEYNAENVLAAICIGLHFGVKPALINEALVSYVPSNNRSQFKKTDRNELIIDAYNANPTSMMASITNFRHVEADKKAVIIGDMFELGEQSEEEHRKIVALLRECAFDKVLLVGNRFGEIPSDFMKFTDTQSLAGYLADEPLAGYTILVKGSHGMRLDRCVDLL